MLLRRGLRATRTLLEPEGRLISIDLENLTIVCIYAPAGSEGKQLRKEFFQRTVPAYVLISRKPVVLLGDFNAVEVLAERTTSPRANQLVSRPLIEMIKGLELVDVWKAIRPDEPGFTFHCSMSSARLDRIYVSRNLNFMDIRTESLLMGDHQPVVGYLNVRQPEKVMYRGHDMWKLNTSILSEGRYEHFIKDFIDKISTHPTRNEDIGHWWEHVFKPGVKRVTITYCKQRAWMQRETRKFLQECLQEVVSADSIDWPRYRDLRREFREWETNVMRGFGIRSRVLAAEEDASIFHVLKTRQNYRHSNILEIITQNGNVITSKEEIDNEIIQHFTKIFKGQPSSDIRFSTPFLNGVRNVFTPTDNSLTTPITVQEIKSALLASKSNKSPGTDGIPSEFYLKFWDIVAPHFLDMSRHVLERGSVLPSQGRAAIRLIPKMKNPRKVGDYRPIALLNCDYKILASVLANRLRRTLTKTTGDHQKGGVPGRFIYDSLCLFRDIIQHVEERSEVNSTFPSYFGAAIIGFDLEKAYDLVNRDVLWTTMATMGYPTEFIGWLKALYSIVELCPLNGSTFVGSITDVQSVRQGCPLSVHLFALYIEPLLCRLATRVTGVNVFGHKVAVRAYVDDLVVVASTDSDILRSGETIDEFCMWTKAKVNKEKSKALGMGMWRDRTTWPLPWLESTPPLRLLGVRYSASIKETTDRE